MSEDFEGDPLGYLKRRADAVDALGQAAQQQMQYQHGMAIQAGIQRIKELEAAAGPQYGKLLVKARNRQVAALKMARPDLTEEQILQQQALSEIHWGLNELAQGRNPVQRFMEYANVHEADHGEDRAERTKAVREKLPQREPTAHDKHVDELAALLTRDDSDEAMAKAAAAKDESEIDRLASELDFAKALHAAGANVSQQAAKFGHLAANDPRRAERVLARSNGTDLEDALKEAQNG